jgi:heat-inducible transcriptional repressor
VETLDPRKGTILRAIVRDYVRSGEPVGSQSLARRYRLKVSAATVRNDMALLEELGYVTQPYTSAGRVPTDLGYRWFIDNWPRASWPDLPKKEQVSITKALQAGFGGLDETLDSTSQVLSDVTEATSVVVAPPARKNMLSRVELIFRDSRRATLLLIADTGVVEQGMVEFSAIRTADGLEELARRLNPELEGVAFEDLSSEVTGLESVSAKDRKSIADAIDRIFLHHAAEKMFRGGTANILDPEKFSDISIAHEVVEALEDPFTFSTIVKAARQASAVLVFVGREVPVEQMQTCGVVFAPYDAGSNMRGTLGIVGPVRMDYPHTISAVESIAASLSRLLGGD